jgi:hypothetical protein
MYLDTLSAFHTIHADAGNDLPRPIRGVTNHPMLLPTPVPILPLWPGAGRGLRLSSPLAHYLYRRA